MEIPRFASTAICVTNSIQKPTCIEPYLQPEKEDGQEKSIKKK